MKHRLRRLMGKDGRCFDVAIDHGLFNEGSFLTGIESLPKAIDLICAAAPDAIQLPIGSAHLLQERTGPKPALVLRTDVANVYGASKPRHLFSLVAEDAVEQAVMLDAACVVVNLLLLPDEPELHAACLQNISRLKPQCERYGMPLMIEPLAMQPISAAGAYGVDGDIAKIKPLVRQAAEMGADVIKADPCDNPLQYGEVIEVACAVPVLVRGGGRASDSEILSRTESIMRCGASGIVYGRNVIQHPNPGGMVKALMSIVHEGATAEESMAML